MSKVQENLERKKLKKFEERYLRMKEIDNEPITVINLPRMCATCLHYYANDCRINPPVAMLIDEELQAVFPPVVMDGYCSKYEYDPQEIARAQRYLVNGIEYIGKMPEENNE